MKFVDGILDRIKLNDADEDEEYLDDDMDDSKSYNKSYSNPPAVIESIPERKSQNRFMGGTTVRKKTGTGNEICIIKPVSYDDSKEVIETLLANCAVVLNMETTDMSVAQRILDMVSGATFAIHGKLQKISSGVFIVSPSNVEISGDFQGILDDDQ